MIFKEVWQFRSAPSGSWNEVYYSDTTSLQVAANFNADSQLVQRRLALLHPVNKLTKIRISDISTPRLSVVKTINRQGTAPIGTVEGPANLDEAAVITLSSILKPSTRKVWMRGLAEDDVRRNHDTGVDILSPSALQRLNDFISSLTSAANSYCVLTRKRIGQEGIVKYEVDLVDGLATPGRSKITTKTPHTLVAGNIAVFNLFDPKVLPGLKGFFQVLDPVTATTFHINYKTALNALLTASRGYIYKRDYHLGAFIDKPSSGFAYLGSRRSKNEGTGSRGAKRAVRLRHA